MGLFGDSKKCAVCGGKTSMINRAETKDKQYLCVNCCNKCGFTDIDYYKRYDTDYLKSIITSVDDGSKQYLGKILFDDKTKQCWNLAKPTQKINYDDIVSYELIDDKNSSTISSGGLGRAIVGGALFGTTGAIVGSVTGSKETKTMCNTLTLKLTVRGNSEPAIYIDFLTKPTEAGSPWYKYVVEAIQSSISKLELILTERKNTTGGSGTSDADEILKFKRLLDAGIITQEEFTAKKKSLLGM